MQEEESNTKFITGEFYNTKRWGKVKFIQYMSNGKDVLIHIGTTYSEPALKDFENDIIESEDAE